MPKLLPTLFLLLTTALPIQIRAQSTAPIPAPDPAIADLPSTLTVRSNLVLVPALVKTKAGAVVYTLTANDFTLTDDGIPQPLHLEADAGDEPIALVVLVEVGGDGRNHLNDYARIAPLLDAIVGNVPHRIAVVTFDSAPVLEQKFTTQLDRANSVLTDLVPGDSDAAILDALTYSVNILRTEPTSYRRAILYLGETLDHGSHASLEDTVRAVDDTNTAVYSFGFNSSKAESRHEASKLSSDEPGPTHGCFSHDPNTDPTLHEDGSVTRAEESKSTQYYDCVAQLVPPLRLARIALQLIINSFHRNIPEAVAQLTGGEYYSYKDPHTLERGLVTLSNHVPNRYILSFRPQNPHPGFHTLQLKLNDYNLKIEARNGYWVEDATK